MGETEKNLQAALAKLTEISKRGLGIAKESISQSSHTVKVKLDINTLQRERKRISTDLGEEVYSAIKAGKLKSKLFDDLVNNIGDLDASIEEKTKELTHADEGTSEKATPVETSDEAAPVESEEEKEKLKE